MLWRHPEFLNPLDVEEEQTIANGTEHSELAKDPVTQFALIYRPRYWWYEIYNMVRRLLLTCVVLWMNSLTSTTFFVVSTVIVTLVIEQESKAYTHRFDSAFTTIGADKSCFTFSSSCCLMRDSSQAVVCSAIIMLTNLLLMATVFVKTKIHETHHVRHVQRVTLEKGRATERKSDVLNVELVKAAQTHPATPCGNDDRATEMVEDPLRPSKARPAMAEAKSAPVALAAL